MQHIHEIYESFLLDTEIDKLQLQLKQENIFSILKIQNAEIRHSNFLAWLLSPDESHNLSGWFIKRFLSQAVLKHNKDFNLGWLTNESLLNVKVYREWNFIDLLIESDNWVVVIENKNRSNEHGKQLEEYKQWAESMFLGKKRFYVFLTLFGSNSSMPNNFFPLSYSNVAKWIIDILNFSQASISQRTRIYLEDYLQILNQSGVNINPTQQLAQKIYLNHKELIDFINRNRQNSMEEFSDKFSVFISSKGMVNGSKKSGFIRFYPSQLNEFIPKGRGDGWEEKESFLFEFFIGSDCNLSLKATVNDNDEEAGEVFKEIFRAYNNKPKIVEDTWYWFFEQSEEYLRDNVLVMEENILGKYFEELWEKIPPIY